jgi:hypothetical protein
MKRKLMKEAIARALDVNETALSDGFGHYCDDVEKTLEAVANDALAVYDELKLDKELQKHKKTVESES